MRGGGGKIRGMQRTLIIGYGNPLRGDDGIGCRAAELLAEGVGEKDGETRPLQAGGVEVIACHQLTVELAAEIAEVDRLILMDACASGEPGTITEQALAPQQADRASLTHHVDAAGLLALAQILYGHAPTTTLFTVSGGSFDYGETFTPAVAAALPALLARVRGIVGRQ